ncbi:hypothetical protein BD560DRAFT_235537 [Blakeslea trispora]|nr:hypothetical protein BD560DRAFT_235537 [Blakeslea trispora]
MENLSYNQRINSLITQVNDDVLRNSLQHEIRKLLEDQQNLVSMIHNQAQTFKIETDELKDIVYDGQKRYEKAVREMQFYKKKYDKLVESLHHQSTDYSERVSPWIEDRARRFRDSSSASLHSSISSNSNNSQIYDDRKPANFSRNPSVASAYSTPSSIAAYSTPSSVTASSTTGNTRASLSAVAPSGNLKIQQQKTDPLIFGGSEAFWDTICKKQGDDANVEKIINNFLRRGGSPNTAMQSPSQNAVKYGYGMIHALIVTKSPVSLDLLLQQGANPNAVSMSQIDEDRVSPCYLAASIGWLEGLQKLVQAGGDLMSARGYGKKKKTALHAAAENGHASVVDFIVAVTEGVLNMETDTTGKLFNIHHFIETGIYLQFLFIDRGQYFTLCLSIKSSRSCSIYFESMSNTCFKTR